MRDFFVMTKSAFFGWLRGVTIVALPSIPPARRAKSAARSRLRTALCR